MIRSIALALTLLIPDRLPSLVILVGFWIPPAVVGFAVADLIHQSTTRIRPALIYTGLAIFAVGWAAVWFLFQLDRIPPYVPGATNGSNVRTTGGRRGTRPRRGCNRVAWQRDRLRVGVSPPRAHAQANVS